MPGQAPPPARPPAFPTFALIHEQNGGVDVSDKLLKWTVQVMVVPISEASLEYAQQVRSQLRKAKLHADVDATDRKMQKKVREAQLAQYNYILVSAPTVFVPTRCGKAHMTASM